MRGVGGQGWGRDGARPRRATDPWSAAKRCVMWARPIMPILLFGAVCTMVGVFLAQQPPRLYKYTIDTIIGQARYNELWRMIVLVSDEFISCDQS